VRARLPHAILAHHDQFAAAGKPSAAEAHEHLCGACGAKLSHELVAVLASPGHFGVCPQCGVFLWRADADARTHEASPSSRRSAVKVSHG
jgi:predicted  nucleic acid-binding Zn-ribbon protein